MKKFLITKIALSCLLPIVLLSCDDKNDPSIDSDTKFKKTVLRFFLSPQILISRRPEWSQQLMIGESLNTRARD